MKKILCILISIITILSLTVLCFAHSGRTDSSGGHRDSSTGEYHYHHGYPAHQHPNGKCPYDFDDKTEHNSTKESNKNHLSNSSNTANASNFWDDSKTVGENIEKYLTDLFLSAIVSIHLSAILKYIVKFIYNVTTKKEIAENKLSLFSFITFMLITIIVFLLIL